MSFHDLLNKNSRGSFYNNNINNLKFSNQNPNGKINNMFEHFEKLSTSFEKNIEGFAIDDNNRIVVADPNYNSCEEDKSTSLVGNTTIRDLDDCNSAIRYLQGFVSNGVVVDLNKIPDNRTKNRDGDKNQIFDTNNNGEMPILNSNTNTCAVWTSNKENPYARQWRTGTGTYDSDALQMICLKNQDCVIDNNWSDWGECSKECGGGTQTRTKQVIKPQIGLGEACGETVQTRECNTNPCPIDCVVGAWGEWSNCTRDCGGGEQNRNRTIVVQPQYGGKECPPLVETRECNKNPCPVDCVMGPWSDWSSCSRECGGGKRTRTREILTESDNGGALCGETTQTEDCNMKPCDIDCVQSEWSNWSRCSKECDGGITTRTRKIITQPKNNGRQCGVPTEEESCNTQPCEVLPNKFPDPDPLCLPKEKPRRPPDFELVKTGRYSITPYRDNACLETVHSCSNGVSLFENDNYNNLKVGNKYTLNIGEYSSPYVNYNQKQYASSPACSPDEACWFGDFSSIRVPKGCKVELFDELNFKGNSWTAQAIDEDVEFPYSLDNEYNLTPQIGIKKGYVKSIKISDVDGEKKRVNLQNPGGTSCMGTKPEFGAALYPVTSRKECMDAFDQFKKQGLFKNIDISESDNYYSPNCSVYTDGEGNKKLLYNPNPQHLPSFAKHQTVCNVMRPLEESLVEEECLKCPECAPTCGPEYAFSIIGKDCRSSGYLPVKDEYDCMRGIEYLKKLGYVPDNKQAVESKISTPLCSRFTNEKDDIAEKWYKLPKNADKILSSHPNNEMVCRIPGTNSCMGEIYPEEEVYVPYGDPIEEDIITDETDQNRFNGPIGPPPRPGWIFIPVWGWRPPGWRAPSRRIRREIKKRIVDRINDSNNNDNNNNSNNNNNNNNNDNSNNNNNNNNILPNENGYFPNLPNLSSWNDFINSPTIIMGPRGPRGFPGKKGSKGQTGEPGPPGASYNDISNQNGNQQNNNNDNNSGNNNGFQEVIDNDPSRNGGPFENINNNINQDNRDSKIDDKDGIQAIDEYNNNNAKLNNFNEMNQNLERKYINSYNMQMIKNKKNNNGQIPRVVLSNKTINQINQYNNEKKKWLKENKHKIRRNSNNNLECTDCKIGCYKF